MRTFLNFHILTVAACLFLLAGCKHNQENPGNSGGESVDYLSVVSPTPNADSAFYFLANQVAFGYRHPGTTGHARCADYIANTLSRWCDTVIRQNFSTTLWDGQRVEGCNIIASLRPELDNRVLLAAHWDSRQWADHDIDTTKWRQPLLGANDGASGVAVVLELARVMSAMPPNVGVDFILFDVEDQGIAEWAGRYEDNTWCKGSQHWGRNPHRMFYTAQYGILFDMVGTAEPRFTKEEISMSFAQGVMNKMWRCAKGLGYGNIFEDELSGSILDDHLYINQLLQIPTIDVVQNSRNSSFCTQWHTVSDNLDEIDRETLAIVANVTLKMIYYDFPPEQ